MVVLSDITRWGMGVEGLPRHKTFSEKENLTIITSNNSLNVSGHSRWWSPFHGSIFFYGLKRRANHYHEHVTPTLFVSSNYESRGYTRLAEIFNRVSPSLFLGEKMARRASMNYRKEQNFYHCTRCDRFKITAFPLMTLNGLLNSGQ